MGDTEQASHRKGEEEKARLFFLVGPPRSGTKLLRGILNQAEGVAVAPESHIYPKLLHRFQNEDAYSHRSEILELLKRSLYMERLQRNGYKISLEDLVRKGDSIADVVRRFIDRVAKEIDPEAHSIGDKTPSYSSHLSTLHAFFPDARFVAIFRDPRDRALSIKSSWGKSIEMAALNWRAPVRKILEAKDELGEQLLMLRYEELLEDPENTVQRVCDHLGIRFDEKMLKEADSGEKLGSVQRMKGIDQGNSGKYWTGMSREQIRTVERTLLSEMKALGYPVHFAEESIEPPALRVFFLRLYDFFQNVRFHIRHKGLKRGLPYLIRIKKDKQV